MGEQRAGRTVLLVRRFVIIIPGWTVVNVVGTVGAAVCRRNMSQN